MVSLPLVFALSIAAVTFAALPTPRENDGAVGRQENSTDTGLVDTSHCSCSGPSCSCCVDFNFTLIDLGGPGCVRMKYLSQEEGILVNVSYGDSQLHGEQIKGPKPSVTCMNMFLQLAQMCARFTDVEQTDDGMRACTALEPMFLGELQEGYPLGCFVMGPQGMRLVSRPSSQSESPVKPADESLINTGESEEDLIAAVNETAEEGIAWFSSFLGFNFGKIQPNSTEAPSQQSSQNNAT